MRRKTKLTVNCEMIYSPILDQCTDYLLAKPESLEKIKGIEHNFDVKNLMKAINSISYQIEGQKYHPGVIGSNTGSNKGNVMSIGTQDTNI
jgi:hypothetical protein